MKKIMGLLLISCGLFATPSFTGLTGGIDFPNAYILIDRNYTISGIASTLEGELKGDLVIETNLLPQVEAGIKLSTLKKELDSSFLQANFKFQVVGEGIASPAIALGFTEFDAYNIQAYKGNESIEDNAEAYGYIVASKKITLKDSSFNGSLGLLFTRPSTGANVDAYATVEVPLAESIKLITEVYSYERDEQKKSSVNVGFDFLTNDKFRTQVYWRERNNSFGVSVNYIGILNNKK